MCVSGGNLFKSKTPSEYEQLPINLRLFQNTVKLLDNLFLSKKAEIGKWINSQSLEDTQVGYISQKYTLDKYTLEK